LRVKEEYLQTTIEELETANEELQSTNEELQSTNEEAVRVFRERAASDTAIRRRGPGGVHSKAVPAGRPCSPSCARSSWAAPEAAFAVPAVQ